MWILKISPYLLLVIAFLITVHVYQKETSENKKSKKPLIFAFSIMLISGIIQCDKSSKNEFSTELAKSTFSGVDTINQKVASLLNTLDEIELELVNISEYSIDSLNLRINGVINEISNANKDFKKLANRGNDLSLQRIELLKKELEQSKPIITMYPSHTDTISLKDQKGQQFVQLELFVYNQGNHSGNFFHMMQLHYFQNQLT